MSEEERTKQYHKEVRAAFESKLNRLRPELMHKFDLSDDEADNCCAMELINVAVALLCNRCGMSEYEQNWLSTHIVYMVSGAIEAQRKE